MRNSEAHPEAWQFYVEQARNIAQEPELVHLGNYRIPKPNMSGDFIYALTVEELWSKFIRAWYAIDINSHSVYGKIQYIVQNF
jgi:hypothetical protein